MSRMKGVAVSLWIEYDVISEFKEIYQMKDMEKLLDVMDCPKCGGYKSYVISEYKGNQIESCYKCDFECSTPIKES